VSALRLGSRTPRDAAGRSAGLESSSTVQDVFQRASQGVSGREIAKVAGVSEATVRRILRSTTVEGDAVRRPVGLNPL